MEMIRIDPEKLLILRKGKGITQKEMAEWLNINQGGYSRKETVGDFTEDEINRISKKLHVKSEEFAQRGEYELKDIYQFLAENAIRQESIMRIVLTVVGELLAEKKGVPVGTLLNKLTEEVNHLSAKQLEKLKPK
jgi:transcriptional regulator with XRE-family HTH domain